MVKRSSLVLAVLFLSGSLAAQKVPSLPLSIPVYHPMVLNPAFAGSKDFVNFSLTSKISKYPNNQIFNYHQRLKSGDGSFSKLGGGAYLFHERLEKSWNMGLAVAGAYHISLDQEKIHNLSVGASLKGFFTTPRSDEGQYPDSLGTAFRPNLDLGVYYYGPKAFGGLSVTTLAPGALDSTQIYAYIDREYNAFGGYKFVVSRTHGIVVEPSLLLSVNDQSIKEAHKHLVPYLKIYLQNFYVGTYLKDLDIFALFFQYQFPRFYTGVFLEFPRVGYLNDDNIIFELSMGLNLGDGGAVFSQYRHW